MILLIDNYDSFTYNLYQYFGELGEDLKVIRNDQLTIEDIKEMNPEAIVLSPGPGRPEHAGICVETIRHFYKQKPILGICLGHQAIGFAFGAAIVRAENIMHGKTSRMQHEAKGLFANLPQPLEVMRYHSLVIARDSLPEDLIVLGTTTDDNEIMAIKHRHYPTYGMQFHPESVGTIHGKKMLANFLTEIRKGNSDERIS
jgi:anthranilate synthase component 2